MKTIIAGSRKYKLYGLVRHSIERCPWHHQITEVVSGTAQGVDRLAEHWAGEHRIPVNRFPAEWSVYGKAAGPRRNQEMADYADALIAVWDGVSPGTRDMIERAHKAKLRVFIVTNPGAHNDPEVQP